MGDPKVFIGPLTAVAMLLTTSSVVVAQVVDSCRNDGACAGGECQILSGGFINTCNCCALTGGLWQCCDNIPCSQCVGP